MNIVKGWFEGLIYPFKEEDWLSKMWVIPILGFTVIPLIELIVLRGWRVELVRRIGLKEDYILPKISITHILRYFIHGLKLWMITGIYLTIPIIVFRLFGINPFRQLGYEIGNLFVELWNYMWGIGSGVSLLTLFWDSFWAITKELLIQNAWLLFYYPYYRTATIRYAITNRFRKSHLAFWSNIRFMIRNVKDFVVMLINQIIDKVILFFVTAIINIILTPFIGVFALTFLIYADYWTSGYEYGMIAQKMVAQDYPQLLEVDVTDEGEYDQEVEFV